MQALTTTPTSRKSSDDWRPSLSEHHESLTKAADACARFIADMANGRPPYWLTLVGQQGVGKTMLAEQMLLEARRHNPGDQPGPWIAGTGIYDENRRRPRCVWFTAPQFKDRMLGGDFDLPEYLRADFLVVLDDLGASRDNRNDALADGLYRLADLRMHRWTVWTSNLNLQEISQRLDPRISSRLIRDENKLINITAPDYARVRR